MSGLPDFAVSADEQSVAAVYGAASLLSKPIDVAGAQMAFPMYNDAQEPLEGVKVALSNVGVAGEYLYGNEPDQYSRRHWSSNHFGGVQWQQQGPRSCRGLSLW